jgi:hypothetical protein
MSADLWGTVNTVVAPDGDGDGDADDDLGGGSGGKGGDDSAVLTIPPPPPSWFSPSQSSPSSSTSPVLDGTARSSSPATTPGGAIEISEEEYGRRALVAIPSGQRRDRESSRGGGTAAATGGGDPPGAAVGGGRDDDDAGDAGWGGPRRTPVFPPPPSDDGGDGDDRGTNDVDDDDDDDHGCGGRWSALLSTPPTNPLFSPSIERAAGGPTRGATSLHGLGMRCVKDGIADLSTAGKGRANLLVDVSALLDDMADSLSRSCQSTLTSSTRKTSLTRLGRFVSEIGGCVLSYAERNRSLGASVRDAVASPYRVACDSARVSSSEKCAGYGDGRSKCARSRSEALAARGRYLDRVGAMDGAVRSLGRAVRASRLRGTIGGAILRRGRATVPSESSRPSSPSSNDEEGPLLSSGGGGAGGPAADAPPSAPSPSSSSSSSSPPPPWEDELRRLAERYRLSRQVCESVTRAHDDVVSAGAEYASCVEAENAAVEEALALEREALDSLQRLEEVRRWGEPIDIIPRYIYYVYDAPISPPDV